MPLLTVTSFSKSSSQPQFLTGAYGKNTENMHVLDSVHDKESTRHMIRKSRTAVPVTRHAYRSTAAAVCAKQEPHRAKQTQASSHPNIARHVPPLRAQLFRTQARAATAPRCRACSASREHLLGPLYRDKAQAHSNSTGTSIYELPRQQSSLIDNSS